MDHDKLLGLGTELGRRLMSSGAEIYRVEESVRRLLTAYGLEPQVFAIPNCLIVSITTPEGRSLTRMCRIPPHGTDIELLERCNALCRRLCRQPVPVGEAQRLVEQLPRESPVYSPRILLLGYMAASAFFALFFGGRAGDSLCAALCGLAVGLCLIYGKPLTGGNSFFHTAVSAALAAALSLLLAGAGLCGSPEAVTIGTLMVLVPGMALTSAMREIMAGDILSGLERTAEVILTATAIALGTALPLALDGGAAPAGGGAVPLTSYLPCLWAFLACVGFGLVYNIQGHGILICGLGAAFGWLIYLLAASLGTGDILAAFAAAVAISAYSEGMARLRRCPVTGYLQVALLPLVPGAGIYHAMQYCVAGQTQLFLSTLLHTLGCAATLAVGAMLFSSLLRTLAPRFRRGMH